MFLPAAAFLFLNTMYLMLRVSPASGSFPRPLSAEEEREALLKSAAGDIQARNLLIEHNLRLVAHVIKKYYASREDQDDLISIGTFGLIKAISSFNPEKGARLATYASREKLMKPAATPCGGRMGCTCLCTVTTARKSTGMWC